MSQAGMAGMQLAARGILTIGETLDPDQWQLPSAASGWSVQDVVVHAGCLLGLLMAAVGGETVPEIGIEALNDMQVAEKRGWNSAQALDALQQNLEKAQSVFAPLQDEPLASAETQMLDLGSYPLHSIVDMFTFDLTTHLRYNILAPRGPVDRHPPPLGEAQLVPAVSWLLGGVPKMQPDLPQYRRAACSQLDRSRHPARNDQRQWRRDIHSPPSRNRPYGRRDDDLINVRFPGLVDNSTAMAAGGVD
jgi:hypothetical protein